MTWNNSWSEVTSDHLSLQDGSATVKFNTAAGGPVNVVITDGNGNQVATATVTAAAGSNSFAWNGQNSAGNTEPDGSYAVNIQQTDSTGTTTQLPTTIVGTVTGVTASGTNVTVSLGDLSVAFAKLTSLASS